MQTLSTEMFCIEMDGDSVAVVVLNVDAETHCKQDKFRALLRRRVARFLFVQHTKTGKN
jgi:hypothetical protein